MDLKETNKLLFLSVFFFTKNRVSFTENSGFFGCLEYSFSFSNLLNVIYFKWRFRLYLLALSKGFLLSKGSQNFKLQDILG